MYDEEPYRRNYILVTFDLDFDLELKLMTERSVCALMGRSFIAN